MSGSNFGATADDNTVQFNGVDATVVSASSAELVVVVPEGATEGPLKVTTADGSAVSSTDFIVIISNVPKAPTITSFSPTEGPVGAQVVVSGSDFYETAAGNTVKFNGLNATVLSASSTELVTVVPAGATSGPLRVVTLSGLSAVSSADFTVIPDPTGINWVTRTFGPTVFGPQAIAHNGTRFVAGGGASIDTSPDALVWTKADGFGLSGVDVAWNGQLLVAVGGPYWLSTSVDGRIWTIRHLPEDSPTPAAVAAGPAMWVVVGESGMIATSPDGSSWSARTSGTTKNLLDVAWAAGRFVAVGAEGAVVTSPDGETWTVQEPPTTDDIEAVGGNSSLIVAAKRPPFGSGLPYQLLTSSNGVDWNFTTAPGYTNSIIYAGGRFVAAGAYTMTSVDGDVWQSHPQLPGIVRSMVYVDGEYFGIGTDFYSVSSLFASSDGQSWRTAASAHNLRSVARSENDGRLVAVAGGNASMARTSTDNGATWTHARIDPVLHQYQAFDIVWSPTASAFVANLGGGGAYYAYTSIDGATWTKRGGMHCMGALAASPSGLVSVGTSSTGACVSVSNSGETWTSVTPPSSSPMRDVFWTGSQFVAVGDGGLIATSPNGSDWTVRTSNVMSNLYGVAASGAMLVAVGGAGAIVTSDDGGVTWAARSSGLTSVLRQIAFNGSGFMVVGAGSEVLTSSTGEGWVSHATGYKDIYDVLWIPGGSQWLVVGDKGLVATATSP